MSVQQQLGLEDDSLLVQQIRERWSTWSAHDEHLAAVEEFDEFRDWLRTAGVEERDDALYALAWMAAKDGGDDLTAGATLAWALLPGAATLAARLAGFAPRIDDLVAAQLWIEVRSFPWKRRRRVAANILASTRAGVLLDLGDIGQVIRADRVWANTSRLSGELLEGDWLVSDGRVELRARARDQLSVDFNDELTSAQEVDALLTWGVREGLINDRDRLVLTELIDEAETTTPARARTANCGLGGREITRQVGDRLGVSPATVRRHLNSSVAALAAASHRYVA
jgi:hypothetical protein